MKKTYLLLPFLFFLFVVTVYGIHAPVGPVKLIQPDGATFMAIIFGDEFLNWKETMDGYPIIKNCSDGYYYFAQQSIKGNLEPTSMMVGKDKPTALQLTREFWPTPEAIKNAEQKYQDWSANKSYEQWTDAKFFGIILISFPGLDFKWDRYDAVHFENLFFSKNSYGHPDGQQVFGSINDYFREVSYTY